jgi:NAD-dependent SIR2 family protein deacetylase
VVELHGNLDRVICLECGAVERRARVQERLLTDNPVLVDRAPPADAEIAPDGDARLAPDVARGFRVPDCRACGGTLKPDVVFFGESVPPGRVASAWSLYEEAEALLVAGSSLSVWSGYRFVARAAEEGVPVAIVNVGATRGDDDARVRVSGRVGSVLPALARELTRPDAA